MPKFRIRALFISLIVFTLGITQLHGLQLAHAEEQFIVLLESPMDREDSEGLPPEYDISQVAFGINKDYPDFYDFFINFNNPIVPDQFDRGDGSFASLWLDLDNDSEVDYSLDTSDQPYIDNNPHSAVLVDRRGGGVKAIDSCEVETWTNIEIQATWIAFSVPRNCLDFGVTFGVLGYAGRDVGTNNFDFSDEKFWSVNPNEPDLGETAVPDSSFSDLPFAPTERVSVIANPADAPADLSVLSRSIAGSVVTVWCGNGLGSGWSAKVDLSQSLIDTGIRSYIVTNHHVIEECTDGREIRIDLSNGDRVSGRVVTWNKANDLGGIVTSTSIPGLDWLGPEPKQGWWVGAIGSPVGQPGILTTGIVSSAPANFEGFMSTPINPGNSGGPVFDNQGRVIGVATSIALDFQGKDTQGLNMYKGTPLLCDKIVDCSASDIWAGSSGSLFPSGAGLYIPLGLIATGAIIGAIFFTRGKRTPSYVAAPFAQSPNFNRSMPPPPGSMPPPPGSMPPPPGSMPPRPPGSR